MLRLRTSQAIAQQLHLKAGKPLKFRNQPCEVEGIWFQSKAEAKRYCDLIILQRAGLITSLACQKRFDLLVNGARLGAYVADFEYFDIVADAWRVEDVKGVRTPLYLWKRAHMKAQYDIDIVEV